MLTVEEALGRDSLAREPALRTERVELHGALWARARRARRLPPRDSAVAELLDGRLRGPRRGHRRGAPRSRVVGRVAAGVDAGPRAWRRGEAMRIFTGAPLPEGADAVVPQEDVEAAATASRSGGAVDARRLRAAARARTCGSAIACSSPARVLGAAEIGLLATLGYAQVRVYRRPRVAILSTGNELADLGAEPGPGQIPNTNTYSLMAQVLEAGAEPVNLGVAPRPARGDRGARCARARAADVLVSSAGVSVGELDLVREALTRAGAELHLWQVSMRPGKPITFGSLGRPSRVRAARQPGLGDGHLRALRAARAPQDGRPAYRSSGRASGRGRSVRDPESGLAARLSARAARADGQGWAARLTGEQGSAILRSMVVAEASPSSIPTP